MERFQREARAASALNHPNICTVYDVGEFEGRPFLVMEYLEGATLRQCIDGRPLDLERLLDVAIQVSSALETAHAKGIIHRDIKPGNILITDSGQAKVLDFGLAKLAVEPGTNPADSSTETLATTALRDSLTEPGSAVGTVAYMSPEQVRGEPLDRRTDLFSFGIVLYEMATGHQAFSGNTSGVIVEAILNRQPQPARTVNPRLPAKLGEVIEKSLEKDRKLRYQTASDMRADLQRVKRDSESGRTATMPLPVAPPRRRLWLYTVGALLLGAVTLATAIRLDWFGSGTVAQFPEIQRKQVTANPEDDPVLGASISPDGQYVAYADLSGVHIRLIATGEMRALSLPPGFCFR
jgi:serine/threonine protein kinase